MKEISIKIQSITDLITNSSSEVFVVATDATMKILKEMCQFIIGDQKLDDVFEFKYKCTVYKDEEEKGEDDDYDSGDWDYELLTEEEFKSASTVDEHSVLIKISSKDPKYDKFIENLNRLVYSHELEVSYNG